MVGMSPIFYSFCLHMYVMYTPWYLCIFYHILYFKYYHTCWRFSDLSVVVFWSCDFHIPKYETRHRITLPHGNRSMTFYNSIIQAKSLRTFRQMKEMFAVLHYTPQEIWLFKMWGEFSAKITHFMLMHIVK